MPQSDLRPGDRVPPTEIPILLPGRYSAIRAAMASCAIENNELAAEMLETIRRVEAGEPVGKRYVDQLDWYVERYGKE